MRSREEFENEIIALEKLSEIFSNQSEILRPVPKSKIDELRRKTAEMFEPVTLNDLFNAAMSD